MEILNCKGKREFLLDLFFPNVCPFCDEFIPYDVLCCTSCFDNALWADEYICNVCGKPYEKCFCRNEYMLYYDRCVCAAYYKDSIKKSVHNMKFHSSIHSAELFGRILADRLKELRLDNTAEVIVPVPMSRVQLKKRGYNQAELIAGTISSGLGIPVDSNALIRYEAQTAQHLLDANERAEAVKLQYDINEENNVCGKEILLVDDVLTTGSTLNYCAYLLKEKLGAKGIICAVAATV